LSDVVPAQGRDAVLSRLLPMAVVADPASAVAAVSEIRDPVHAQPLCPSSSYFPLIFFF
jgi:hypothetical protein